MFIYLFQSLYYPSLATVADGLSTKEPLVEDGSENWVDIKGGEDINHLTADNFALFIAEHELVLVMFYAPCT